jgi:hypothetical protein
MGGATTSTAKANAAAQNQANQKAAQNQADQAAGRGAFAPTNNNNNNNVNQNGGQGKPYDPVTNPYGVHFVSGHANAYGESQINAQGTKDLAGKPITPTSRANEYGASLVNNAGLVEGSKPYNDAMNNYLNANGFVRTSEGDVVKDPFKPIKYNENYGYTSKVEPIIAKNFSKDPTDVNWDLSFDKPAVQARESFAYQFSKDQGGPKTKESGKLGSAYSWNSLNSKSQSIGDKVFSNQKSFTRDSVFEEATKKSEANKAEQYFSSTSNKDYASGGTKEPAYNAVVTFGKAQKAFGNKTSFGWNDVSKDQLVRGSKEEALSTLGAFAGRGNTRIDNNNGKSFGIDLIDKKQNSKDVFQSIKSGKTEKPIEQKPEETKQDFNTWFSNEESKGATIDVFNSQGAKVGSVKANEQGRQSLEFLGNEKGVYFKESSKSTFDSKQNREFADFISSSAAKGESIDLFSGDKKVASVSGSNAYRDTVENQKIFGVLSAKIDYSTTYEGKSLLGVVSKGGLVTFSDPKTGYTGFIGVGDKNVKSTLNDIVNKSPNGFSYSVLYPKEEKSLLSDIQNNPSKYENKPQSFWDNAYNSGKLQSGDMDTINNIFHSYDREQNKVNVQRNKETAAYISRINDRNDPSYYFNIKDSSGKVVKTTKGQRSFHDFMKANEETDGGLSIEPHFSNTFEAASARENKLSPSLTEKGVEAYGPDANKPQLGPGQSITRFLEQTTGQYIGGFESAFAHLIDKNKSGETTYPGLHGVPETTKNIFTNPDSSKEFSKDIIHTIMPISFTSLFTKGQIQGRNVELTPEATNITNKTSAPSSIAYLMGKEPASPYASKEYYDTQTAFLIGSTVLGLKGSLPITRGANTILVQKASLTFRGIGKDVLMDKPRAAYKGYAIGYDWLGYKDVYGSTPGGRVFGKPPNEKMAPPGYRVVALEQEGAEVANKGNAYSIKKSTDVGFFNYLSKTDRTVQPNAGEIMQAIVDKNKVSVGTGHTDAERPFSAGITTDETAGKGLMKGIVERQRSSARLSPNKGGQLGEVYGSGLTFSGGSKAAVETLKDFGFEQKDVEASIHPFLGLGKQSKGDKITNTIYTNMLKEQGFVYDSESKSYTPPRGPENLPADKQELYARDQIGDLKYDITSSASKRGLYTGGSTFLQLTAGKKGFRPVADVDLYYPVSKFGFIDNAKISKESKIQSEIIKNHYTKNGKNPDDVLVNVMDKDPLGTGRRFIKITDKNTGKSIVEIVPRAKPTKGIIKPDKVVTFAGIRGRKANQIVRDKVIIIKSLEKKQAAGKKLNINQQAKLDKAKKDVVSFRNAEKISTAEMVKSGLLPDYLRTRIEGTKIYSYGKSINGKDVAEGGKIFEIPQLDKDAIASSGQKGSNIFGFKIDKSTKKYPSTIGKDVKGASQVFNKQTQEKKQATLNTKESLSQQGGVTDEHYNILGDKVFLGEAVYSGGKALARGSVLELDDAMRLMSNPSTKEQGLTHLKNIDIVGKGQSWFYGIDWNKFKTTYFEKRGEQVPDSIKPDDSYYSYVHQASGGKPISSFTPTKTSRSSDSSPSSYPGSKYNSASSIKAVNANIISGFSKFSSSQKSDVSFSGKSKSDNSVFSGKSNMYGASAKSNISSPSGKSNLSGHSSPSGKSSPSSKSSLSGIYGKSIPSGFSSPSGKSSPSGFSGLSGPSSPSGKSGVSGFSGTSGTSGVSGYSGSYITNSPPFNIPYKPFGNIRKRRNGKNKEGPTLLINLDVNNVFASGFNIKTPRNQRIEF